LKEEANLGQENMTKHYVVVVVVPKMLSDIFHHKFFRSNAR
jgi:hypothetical protein